MPVGFNAGIASGAAGRLGSSGSTLPPTPEAWKNVAVAQLSVPSSTQVWKFYDKKGHNVPQSEAYDQYGLRFRYREHLETVPTTVQQDLRLDVNKMRVFDSETQAAQHAASLGMGMVIATAGKFIAGPPTYMGHDGRGPTWISEMARDPSRFTLSQRHGGLQAVYLPGARKFQF